MSSSISIDDLQAAAKRYGAEPLLVLPNGTTLDLSNGYIPLLARYTFEDKAAQGLRKGKAGEEPENPIHFSVLELVRDNSILLLTGPSGSGKTTFAKHLSYGLASSGLSNTRPLSRNDLGDIKEEYWGTARLSPCYFSLSAIEDLEHLAEITIPKLLSASDPRHEHLLIILDDLQNAGEESIIILARILPLLRERTFTKLLLLGDAGMLDRLSFPAEIVRHDLLPLLECQRREIVRLHLNLEPSTHITTGMGEAASNPALFALAIQVNHSGNCAEELLDAWLSSTYSQPGAAALLAERAYKLITHGSLTVSPTETPLTSSQLNPASHILAVQRLLAARHLAGLAPRVAVKLFRDQPQASKHVLRSCLLRLSSSHKSAALVDGLLEGTPADATCERAALLVADLIPLSAEVESKVKELVLQVVEKGNLSAGEREKAGRVLSRYSDPRDLTGLVEVPAGSFTMGSKSHPNSQPLYRISLERFRIGLYPVVNRDYGAFVRDTGRYWISPDGEDPERLNAPATDLTWHDARAYCQWLTERWRKEEKISPSEHVRLPSEPEWERAAKGNHDETGTERLVFPWGSNRQEDAANGDETGFNTTCAVGLFPKGRSPYGCYDMAGHVWEWCSTLWGENMATPAFHYPWRGDGRESLDASDHSRRVLRGGCFSSTKFKANSSLHYVKAGSTRLHLPVIPVSGGSNFESPGAMDAAQIRPVSGAIGGLAGNTIVDKHRVMSPGPGSLIKNLDRTCRSSSADMPIIPEFKLPEDASALGRYTTNSTAPFFITFTTSDHPDTGESWCPDVRAALPHIIATFSPSSAPEMAFVEVGQRPE
ncbi:serine/threonine protein kinase [Colletotrichum nymphaeae SA-01]|uniref:Serine/threonine protein kinase n=1 Tax=Colletotrichum nymphaeae SA-01 TaxID=1460502 RepID=A0A135UNB4_9PEZI|nr:serine/threonine protein kinase [Colletotrichum nymphaeae SA-01]